MTDDNKCECGNPDIWGRCPNCQEWICQACIRAHRFCREPAFPVVDEDGAWNGMDLRDWFAGMALAGTEMGHPAARARDAYRTADFMMATRKVVPSDD